MAIARVQGPVIGFYAGTPVTASFVSNPTAGNLMIAYLCGGVNEPVANASISGWTRATYTQSGAMSWAVLFYKVVAAGESKDVSGVWTGSLGTSIAIEEWGGFTGTPTLDKVANSNYTTAVTSKTSGTTATTTANDELCLAVFRHGNTITSPSWTNSFVLETYDNPASILMALVSLVATSTWAAETTQSWTTARVCGGLISTFKGVVTSTWTPKVIMVM